MKLISSIVVGILMLFSCSTESNNSSDSEMDADCPYQVFTFSRGCADNECTYSVGYGVGFCDYTVVETDEATYNFYKERYDNDNKCWEGDAPDPDPYPYSNGDPVCSYRVISLGKSSDTNCPYSIGYGIDSDNYVEIPTNEATYDFYKEKRGVGTCWEGEK